MPPKKTVGAWARFAHEALESLTSQTQRLTEESHIDEWKRIVAGLAGRVCAVVTEPETLLHLGIFLDTARLTIPPGPAGAGALTVAASVVEYGLWASGGQPHHLRCFLDLLASDGNTILWDLFQRERGDRGSTHVSFVLGGPPQAPEFIGHLEEERKRLRAYREGRLFGHDDPILGVAEGLSLWPLARLGDLDREQARRFVRQRRIASLTPLMIADPEHVQAYANWLEATDSQFWIDEHERPQWYLLFANAPASFVRSMAKLVEEARATHGLTWAETTEFFTDLLGQWHSASSSQPRRAFLRQRLWVMKAIVEAAVRVRDTAPEGTRPRRIDDILHDLGAILDLLFRWRQNGFGRESYVARLLLQAGAGDAAAFEDDGRQPWPSWAGSEAQLRLVNISSGDPDQLVALLLHPLVCEYKHRIVDELGGLLRRSPDALRLFLSASDHRTSKEELLCLAPVWSVMERLLSEEELESVLKSWREEAGLTLRGGAERDALECFRGCWRLTAGETALPRRLRPLPDPSVAWRRELEALTAMEGRGNLPTSARARIEHLKVYLANPDRARAYGQAKLTRWAQRHLPSIQIATLTALLQQHISQWQRDVGLADVSMSDRDWSNARRLSLLARENRRLVRRVMRDRATQGHRYGEDHPVNRAFLRTMEERSLRMQAWLAPPEWKLSCASETLRLYAERDPLRIFQMGNLFGTCLSADGYNSHAVVANAVEINKRVLFLQDSRGRIVGRKLIVLSRSGLLIGYQSYGAGRMVWVKTLFDLYCRDLSLEIGARTQLSDEERQLGDDQWDEELALFSKWYDDYDEPFDPWLFLRTARGDAPAPDEHEPIRAWVRSTARSGEDSSAQLRALLWLGSSLALGRELAAKGVFTQHQLAILEKKAAVASQMEHLRDAR